MLAGRMLIGTGGSELVYMEDYNKNGKKFILHGHCVDELWGLCVHPSEPVFFTCGDDALVKKWDVAQRK